jgi:hypothetical protein
MIGSISVLSSTLYRKQTTLPAHHNRRLTEGFKTLHAMFVPRALKLKGVRETKPKLSKPLVEVSERNKDDALVDAMQGISTNSPTPQEDHIEPKTVTRGPRFTVKPVTPEYLAQLAAGIELIFSDYAHQEEVRANWLHQRYRTVDGEEKCTSLNYCQSRVYTD